MRHQVPFFRQVEHYTCGPASLRMILAYLGKTIKEDELAAIARTRSSRGTPRWAMSYLSRTHAGMHVMKHARWEDLRKALQWGPVMVNYVEPEDDIGHYAVVTGYEKGEVILNDPWNGEDFHLSAPEFRKRWLNYKSREKGRGWMISFTGRHHPPLRYHGDAERVGSSAGRAEAF